MTRGATAMLTRCSGEGHGKRRTKIVGVQGEGEPMNTHYRRGDHNMHSTFHPRRFTTFLVPLLALIAIVLMPLASAQAANCHWYNVTLTGTAAWVGIQSARFQNVS